LREEQVTTELTPADILERAADGFESGRYGWTKNMAYRKDSDGNEYYCAMGALYHEAGLQQVSQVKTPQYQQCALNYRKADNALAEVIGFNLSHGGVSGWNDHEANGMAEVIEKMKEAAKNLRNKEEAR
jgi:hypothetical protein